MKKEQKCKPKITETKGGVRECSTCHAKAMTTKSILVCNRTGRPAGK